MLDKEKKVQGVAVYAEFRKPGQVMQILVTPDAYNTSGSLVPMSFHRRIITPATPKKQWRTTSINSKEVKDLIDNNQVLPDSAKDDFTENRMRYTTSYFDNLISHGWTMEKTPILTEISRHDADDIGKSKTPNKVIYRIHISRKALAFPELV
jgi:hypothetical protein